MARWNGQDKWDRENMSTFSIKVKKETGDRFREAVKANGDTMNSVLRKAIEDYIKNNGR